MNSPSFDDDLFWQIVRGRRSVRRYAARPVEPALVQRLLAAAHLAPSAHNRQPWRFVLVNTAAARPRLAKAMAERWQADLIADGADPVDTARRAALSMLRIITAPVVIIPCLDLAALDEYPDEKRQRYEWQMGVQSVALACENLLLAAHHLGLAACWLCAPIFCVAVVQEALALPATWEPQALLTVGYPPPDAPASKPREPLASRVIER